jgi:CMP-N,N'-diacetyllegionaminic acid synthase
MSRAAVPLAIREARSPDDERPRLLLLVTARGGSKGLPGKNRALVGGLTLVERAVLAGRAFAARTAARVEAVVCVDTDDEAIARDGRAAGALVPFLREAEYAADGTSSADSTARFLERWREVSPFIPDQLGLLQPTSPLRTAVDVLACWDAWQRAGSESLVSVLVTARVPEVAYRDAEGRLVAYAGSAATNGRRQDRPSALFADGAVYLTRVDAFIRRHRFITAEETAFHEVSEAAHVDVDTAADLRLARRLLPATAPWLPPPSVTLPDAETPTPLAERAELLDALALRDWSDPLHVDLACLAREGVAAVSLASIRPVRVHVHVRDETELAHLPFAAGASSLVAHASLEPAAVARLRHVAPLLAPLIPDA